MHALLAIGVVMGRALLVALVATCIGESAATQSYIRGFGGTSFDSRAYEGPAIAVRMHKSYAVHGVVGTDGRVYINGWDNYGASRVPDLLPGESFVDLQIDLNIIGRTSFGRWIQWRITSAPGGPSIVPPLPTLPIGLSFERIVAVGYGGLAVLSDGSLYTWQASTTSSFLNCPPVPPGVQVVALDGVDYGGFSTAAAVLSDGRLLIWGDPTAYGQQNVPPLAPGVHFVDVALGVQHVAALCSDGSIVCWGRNLDGECNVPSLPPGVTYTKVAAGGFATVALRSDHQVVSWGASLGPIPDMGFTAANPCVELVCGWLACAARRADGKTFLWSSIATMPLGIAPRADLTAEHVLVGAGTYHGLGVLSDGTVQQFGTAANAPLPAGLDGNRIVTVGGGTQHSLALLDDGLIVPWGSNASGQCNVPQLPAGLRYVKASAGDWHNVALRSDGTAVTWGYNGWQQLPVPLLPPGVTYVDVDALPMETVYLRSDNVIVRRGYQNPSYQAPATPPGVRFVAITGSDSARLCALRSDGEAVLWPSVAHLPGGQDVPPLPWGVHYVEVDGGGMVFGLRRSDGNVVMAGIWAGGMFPTLPPDPGYSYVQTKAMHEIVLCRAGPQSTYVGYGHGCAGSLPPARLVPRDTPKIGRTLEVTVFDLPASLAFMVFGFSSSPPTPLASFGMPGCDRHVSIDGAVLLLGQDQQAKYRLPIPDSPALVGVRFYNQAVVVDPSANALGAVMSDAAEGVIGRP